MTKHQSEEHRKNMREALLRFWASLSPEEYARRKAECRACGLKSAAMLTDADKAAMVARTHTPAVRARNEASIAAAKAKRFAEDPDWLKKILREKWARHDPATEAQRKVRAENARRHMTPERLAALVGASVAAHKKPIEGLPVDGSGEAVRFDSASDAATWLLSNGRGKSWTGVRHIVYEVLAGRRKTAYGYTWHRVNVP